MTHQYRCETCSDLLECKPGEILYAATRRNGCASHSDFHPYNPQYQCGDDCKGECSGEVDGVIKCPYHPQAEIETQCKKVAEKLIFDRCDECCDKCIFCDNAGGCLAESYRNKRAMQAEREKVLDEAIKHWENVIEYGKGVSYNHPVTYEWMYRGVVDYLKELRQKDGE